MSKKETYVSIDIETDGPAPGINSMLALGAAAFNEEGEQIDTWYRKFFKLPEAGQNDETMEWWLTQPEAWIEVNSDQYDPRIEMPKFAGWCHLLPGKKIAVAWPAAFDFAFVNYYCHRFVGSNPLGFACLDIRSYANGLAGFPSYYGLSERTTRMMAGPIETSDLRPHVAIDDAIEQGRLFMALRKSALLRWS